MSDKRMSAWRRDEERPEGLDVKRVKGSGAGWLKGDQVGPHWMVECKTTGFSSFVVDCTTIDKIKMEAAREGKTPVIKVSVQPEQRPPVKVAVLPWSVFITLVQAAERGEGAV